MRSVAKKIFILFGCITLIVLSVIPVFAYAQADTIGGGGGAETVKDLGLPNAKGVDISLAGLGTALLDATGITSFANTILYVLMSLAAGILSLAGLFLDFILKISVVELSDKLDKITSINTTWRYIRDIGNMSFIFILLYEGIRMILGLESSGVKKVIVNIVIAAILVNFSLFFTKVVIDASNILTLGFYNTIVGTGNTVTGLSGVFMNVLRLGDLYGGAGAVISRIFSGSLGTVVLLGNTIFLFIATFVFFVIAVMFVIRYLSFIILLIMSPIAFISMAVPGLGSLKDKYVKTLIGQALFAPVFMLLTLIILNLAGDANFLSAPTTNASWLDILTGANTDRIISAMVDYILLIGLLIYSVILSKQVATKGGFVTNGMINKGTSWVGGAVFGGAAALGRGTVGAAAYKMSNNSDLRARAAAGDKFAQLQLKTLKGVASSSFDARKGFIGETAQKKMGVDFGKGSLFNSKNTGEKGYAGKVERRAKEEAEYIKSLKPTKDEEDEAKARADATMKSDAFKQEEQARKDKHFNAEYRAKVDARRKPLEAALNLANVEKETVEKNIKESEKEIEDTQKIIDNLKNQSGLDPIARQARKDAEKKLASQLEALKNSKELAEQKKKASIKAQEELETFNKKEKEEEDSWESEDLKKLIAYSGGRKGVKGKENIDAISEYQRIATEAAEVFDEKAGASIFTKAWNGNSVLNKKIADKIRAESKAKSDEQQLAEIIKKQAKEAKEAEGKASKPEGDSGEGNKEKTT